MKMKLELIILLTLFTVSSIFATNPFMWEEDGIPIRQGVNIEWSRASAVLDNDTVVYVWSDTRYGGRDLWAQAVDNTGILWGSGGVLVDGKDDRQEDPVVIATSDGNAIIAWIDFYDDTVNGGVYAQKISPAGELLWDDSVALCTADGVQISLNIVPDNDGGAYIIWQDHREGPVGIYGVHVDSDGNNYPGWPEDGLALASGPGNQQSHTFWEDGAGGAILAYVNEYDGTENINVLRVLSDGEIDWAQPLAQGDQEQNTVRMSPFGNDAFGFAYSDQATGVRNIHVNVVDIDGNFLWDDPVILYPSTAEQLNPRVTSAADGNFIVVWEDLRTGSYDLYIQKLDIDGNFMWGQEGIDLVVDPFNQRNPRIEDDANGGCYVVWDDGRAGGHPDIDIYMQHVESDGTLAWEENGRAVTQIPGETFAPLIKPAGDNIYVCWGDMRTGSIGIYYQAYDLLGESIFVDNGIEIYWGLSGDAVNHRVVKNGDDIFVAWQDTRYANFGDQIKVQKIDINGEIQFIENGISITTEHSGRHQESMRAIPHHQGGLAMTWTEQPDAFVLIYAQAIDADGNPLWGDMGVMPSTLDYWYAQANPKISYDGEDGYIIAWDETNQSSTWERDIRAQRIVNGETVWDDEGIYVAYQTSGGQVDHFLEDVVGRYIVWFRSDQTDIYAKLLDEDGQVADGWEDYGNLICSANGTRTSTRSVLTDEGLLIVWEDKRDGASDIYGQLINENGEIQWEENGKQLIDYDNDQSVISMTYDSGYFYLSWRDARIDPGAQDVAIQKFDMNGDSVWGEPAPFVISDDTIQDNPTMIKVGENLLVAWENDYSDVGADVHVQLVNGESGNTTWSSEGEVMSSAEKRQVLARLVPFDDVYAFAAWSDGRSSGKEEIKGVYAQKIDTTFGTYAGDPSIVPTGHLQLHANFPNPFNPETTISFDMNRNDRVTLKVFNVRGQLVRTLIDDEYLERGRYQQVWNGTDNSERSVGSGVYFYKLSGADTEQTRKMLLLK